MSTTRTETSPQNDFLDVTELANEEVSREQVERICHRYYWAAQYCGGKEVVEVACGTGQGLGYLASHAKSVEAGDVSQAMVDRARAHYGERIPVGRFSADNMPFPEASKDVIILHEALYYLPSPKAFVEECRRVLRPGGYVLIATANKDLYDFNPSPYSNEYLGVRELNQVFALAGFEVECFGHLSVDSVSWRQKALRPVKRAAVRWNLMPSTMAGKKLLKRLVFGNLVSMPAEITGGMTEFSSPDEIPVDRPDRSHKVLYCAARLKESNGS